MLLLRKKTGTIQMYGLFAFFCIERFPARSSFFMQVKVRANVEHCTIRTKVYSMWLMMILLLWCVLLLVLEGECMYEGERRRDNNHHLHHYLLLLFMMMLLLLSVLCILLVLFFLLVFLFIIVFRVMLCLLLG